MEKAETDGFTLKAYNGETVNIGSDSLTVVMMYKVWKLSIQLVQMLMLKIAHL